MLFAICLMCLWRQNNLDIVEAQRKYQQQLVELDNKIEEAKMEVDTVYPFVGGARIDHIIAGQEKAQQKSTS